MKKPIVPKNYHRFSIETGRQRVLEVLFKHPDKEFSLSDLAKEAGVAKANIGNILSELEKYGLIQITKLSKIWRISANRTSWMFIKNKIVYNLNFIYQSGVIEFLNEYFKHPKSIILFGSFRKGEDTTGSDIDIAIETDEKEYKVMGLRELIAFENLVGRKIQLHFFNKKNIESFLFNAIANGIVLLGYLEVTDDTARNK